MKMNCCPAIVCCLVSALSISASQATTRSGQQFLSDISSLQLPDEKSPPAAPLPSSVSTRHLTHAPVSSGEAAALRRENLQLKKKVRQLSRQKTDSQPGESAVIRKKMDELIKQNALLTTQNDNLKADAEKAAQQQRMNQDSRSASMLALQQNVIELAKLNIQLTSPDRLRQIAAEQKALAELKKKADSLTAQNAALTAQKQQATEQVAALQKQLSSGEQGRTAALAELKKKADSLAAQNVALTTQKQQATEQVAALQKQLSSGEKSQSALQQKVNMLTKQNESLDTESGKLQQQIEAQQKKAADTVSLKSTLQKQSYTVGVILADEIRTRIRDNHQMGINIDTPTMLAGVRDGYNGHPALDEKQLRNISAAMSKTISGSMKERLRQGRVSLDKALKGKTVLMQKDGIAIVLVKKGKKDYKKGSTILFDSLESTLAGKIIVNNYNSKVVYTDKMSPVLLMAFKEGKQGGHITLYGFAGNIYNRSSIPDGVSDDTPVKVDLIMH